MIKLWHDDSHLRINIYVRIYLFMYSDKLTARYSVVYLFVLSTFISRLHTYKCSTQRLKTIMITK